MKLIAQIKVSDLSLATRLDKFLVTNSSLNRSEIKHKVDQGLIFINNVPATKAGILLKNNDVVLIYEQDQTISSIIKQTYDLNLNICYEDDDLIIINKPSGLLVHETNYHEKETLFNAIRNYSNNLFEPYLVHRIDKDTSGLIIVAKNKQAQELLLDLFLKRKITKKYYALVENNFDQKHFFIDVAIGRSNDNKMKMIAGEGKNLKQALSEINVIKNYHNYSLVEVILHTGRTHQIRVHLNYINHPIVNDPLYNQHKANSSYHQYLMAYYLKFIHPLTNKTIEVQIDLDQEFKDFIKQIENDY